MSKRVECYKIVCNSLNMVLHVKNHTNKESKAFYRIVRKKISDSTGPVSVDSYRDFLLKNLLLDYQDFNKHVEASLDFKEEEFMVVEAVYNCIVELYPHLALEFICSDINSKVFISTNLPGMSEVFQKILEQHMEEGIPDATSLSKKPELHLASLDEIIKLENYLKKNLIGQREAIQAVVNAMKLIASGLNKFHSFFFIGSTGVGKTELSKLLGKKYSGNFFKVNCAEYSGSHEYAKLIGSPPGYVGHTDKSLLAEKAEKSNRWIFLFDEVEKGHPKFHDFLLSLLDDGTVTDNMGRTLDFSESIFVFTSNQGVTDLKLGEQLGFSDKKVEYDECKDEILKSVKKQFNPEFFNRIDNFIFFNSLNKEDARKIASLALKGVPIKRTKSLLNFIVDNGFSPEYGARNIKRFIKNKVSLLVAEEILNKRVPIKTNGMYTPKIVGGELKIVNTEEYDDGKSSATTSGTQ